jgi:hypothetical protein
MWYRGADWMQLVQNKVQWLFCTRQWTSGLHRRQRTLWIAGRLSYGLCSTKFSSFMLHFVLLHTSFEASVNQLNAFFAWVSFHTKHVWFKHPKTDIIDHEVHVLLLFGVREVRPPGSTKQRSMLRKVAATYRAPAKPRIAVQVFVSGRRHNTM